MNMKKENSTSITNELTNFMSITETNFKHEKSILSLLVIRRIQSPERNVINASERHCQKIYKYQYKTDIKNKKDFTFKCEAAKRDDFSREKSANLTCRTMPCVAFASR